MSSNDKGKEIPRSFCFGFLYTNLSRNLKYDKKNLNVKMIIQVQTSNKHKQSTFMIFVYLFVRYFWVVVLTVVVGDTCFVRLLRQRFDN